MVANISLNATNVSTIMHTNTGQLITEIKPLIILTIGIFIYALFIFKFYRFLADKDIIKQHWHKKYGWKENIGKKTIKSIFYAIEYLIISPIAIFFWFLVLAGLLLILSGNSSEQITLIAMAIIGAIRIASHYSNDLSKDLAKMIPFAFLGVYVIEMKTISLNEIISRGLDFLLIIDKLFFFLLFIVILETILRLLEPVLRVFKQKKKVVEEE